MKFACIGWGSLIWNPDGLPCSGPWNDDGPVLPLEFARRSKNQRVTLVISDHGTPCKTLWAPLAVASMEEAVEVLRVREGMPAKTTKVGQWPCASGDETLGAGAVAEWAKARDLAGVVWTALPANWPGFPSLADVIEHLSTLAPEELALAGEYVRRAPKQIATAYRSALEAELRHLEP